MAIDFMVMPLSRYISGDFVTPAMQAAWSLGAAYTLIGPGGQQDIPRDTPFGGHGASDRRIRLTPMLMDDLRKLPAPVAGSLWDEGSAAEPTFHRVHPPSYEALLEEAQVRQSRPSFLGFLKRRQGGPCHVASTLFLPCTFDSPFSMTSPFDRVTGSVDAALHELEGRGWKEESADARETLRSALDDAARLSLPMIVDW
jgi:hypothetical protein